jgi:hypothetical protein
MHCRRVKTQPPPRRASSRTEPDGGPARQQRRAGALGVPLRSVLAAFVTLFAAVPVLARGDFALHSPDRVRPGANYFTREMISEISPTGFISVMQGNCPTSDAEGNDAYNAFPLTICQTQDMKFMVNSTTETQTAVDHFIWANRWTETGSNNSKPNGVFAQTCRLRFSSAATADAATEAEVSYSAGYNAHDQSGNGYLDLTEARGIPDANVLTYDDFVQNLGSLCTSMFHGFPTAPVDTVVLPPEKLADVPTAPKHGITVDWEVQDGHKASETTAAFGTLASIVHGKGLLITLYTNPLDGALVRYNGFVGINDRAFANVSSNTDTVLGLVDYFDLLMSSRNPDVPKSLADQVAQFANPVYAKFEIVWDLQNSVADSATIRTAITGAQPFAGVNFWRNGTSLGGSCSRTVNEQIGNLLGIETC